MAPATRCVGSSFFPMELYILLTRRLPRETHRLNEAPAQLTSPIVPTPPPPPRHLPISDPVPRPARSVDGSVGSNHVTVSMRVRVEVPPVATHRAGERELAVAAHSSLKLRRRRSAR